MYFCHSYCFRSVKLNSISISIAARFILEIRLLILLANKPSTEAMDGSTKMMHIITDDTRGTMFVNEVQPKPTSPGHDNGRTSPTSNTGRFPGFPQTCCPLRTCRYAVMVANSDPPLIFMRRPGDRSLTRIPLESY